MQKYFVTACRLVDKSIRESGEIVSAEERNRRVMAAEYKLRQGIQAERIDTRARLITLSIPVPVLADLERDE